MHVERMVELRNAYNSFVGKTEGDFWEMEWEGMD
jgi:hypothetical protein